MKESVRLALALGGLLLLTAIGACSSTVDEVTGNIACADVCKRYADCFNNDYDVDGCTDKCEKSADTASAQQRKLKQCDACIGERSCTEATFNCAADCAGIVP